MNKIDNIQKALRKGGCQVTGGRYLACIMKKFIQNSITTRKWLLEFIKAVLHLINLVYYIPVKKSC